MQNNVAIYRSKYKVKQKSLAEICNISVVSYCNKENNKKTEFTHSEMVAITNFFKKYDENITAYDLFFREKCFI